jgi:hypothetical protein
MHSKKNNLRNFLSQLCLMILSGTGKTLGAASWLLGFPPAK